MHGEKKESTGKVEDGKGMKELSPLFPEPASPRRENVLRKQILLLVRCLDREMGEKEVMVGRETTQKPRGDNWEGESWFFY